MSDYIHVHLDELYHYGTPRHSGRYPWGSGDNPYQHEAWYQGYISLKSQGLSETEIARGMDISTTELRARKSIYKAEKRAADTALAIKLKDSGMSNVAIGKQMGINESSVRSLLNPVLQERNDKSLFVANVLKDQVAKKHYIDVGPGAELSCGVKPTRFKTAIAMLKDQGYGIHYIKYEQLGTGHATTMTVLAAPGVDYKEVYKNRDKIQLIDNYIDLDARTARNVLPPVNFSSKRLMVRYAEDGGVEKDGVIELRRGVPDISLNNSKYAQVRIAVDGTHYLKGMAMYSDDMPDGVDIIFNTNKKKGTPIMGEKDNTVLKPLKKDKDNPFGATIKELEAKGQYYYIGEDGKEHQSVINKVNDEGDWGKWSKTLASQMLSKQPPRLAKRQLDLAYADRKLEYDEISKLTNPAVKRTLLKSFADNCDSAAVHLKAAALPRQASHVILPIPDMKETEIYAPNYRHGERVCLIRYPHGGIFEIPELTVNNKHATANKLMHNAVDAVGINSKVAERLSGADFDGDTVLVIPTGKVKIRTSSPLEGLKDFDPKESYPGYEGMPKMKSQTKQTEMGKITNLITDMTLKGADPNELARAVRHSMVIIDAEKHNLNYKKSYIDNGIAELKAKYQTDPVTGKVGGSSTLISRAKSPVRVPERRDLVKIDEKTGKKLYFETGATFQKRHESKKNGVTYTTEPRTQKSYLMAETDDAFKLSSGTLMENLYASYANNLKSLANEARKLYLATPKIEYSPSAHKTYAAEVESLSEKLLIAKKNAPHERQAQLMANLVVSAKKKDNPDMSNDELKKLKAQCLGAMRARYGAKKQLVDITDKEWDAIQAGAISDSKLLDILDNTDLDKLKERATPRSNKSLSDAQKAKIRAMEASGYTTSEIANALGVSTSTVSKTVNEKE